MATQDLERLVVQLSADLRKFEGTMARGARVAESNFRRIEDSAARMDKRLSEVGKNFGNGIKLNIASLQAGIAGLSGALGVSQIAAYADEWTIAGNKIAAAAELAGVQTRSLNALKDGANEARTDLTSYVDLYAKLIRSASKVAASENDVARVTEITSKAFKAGGAAAQEQAAGILQLSQALGSGVLQGDELRSLRENAPIIAQAIADEFKTTIAGLKNLGAEGKLTSDRVFTAILNAQEKAERAFKRTNATIADGFNSVRNEFLAYIGNADASAGASRKLVNALQYVAENFKQVADVVLQFAAILAGALVGRAIAGMIVGLGNAVVALGAFITAVRTGTTASLAFGAALGPIGILAGAAASAYLLMGDGLSAVDSAIATANAAINSNAQAMNIATASAEKYTVALRNQIAMQLEAVKAAAIENDAYADVAVARADNFRKLAKSLTGQDLRFAPLEYESDNALAKGRALYKQYGLLEEQLKQVDANLKSVNEGFGGGLPTDSDGGGKDKTKGFYDALKEQERRTAMLREETAIQAQLNPLVNDYGFAVNKLRIEQDLLNEAEKAGVAITPELQARITGLASDYAAASVEADKLAESQAKIKQNAEEFNALAKDVTRGIVDGFIQGKSAADIFADALGKIGNKLLDLAFDDAFGKGGIFGGTGGFLAGLFGGKGYARGGYTGQGGKYDPAGIVHKGEYVVPKNVVDRVGVSGVEARLAGASAPRISSLSAGSNGGASFTFAPQIDNRGASVETVAQTQKMLNKLNSEFEARVTKTLRNNGVRNVKQF